MSAEIETVTESVLPVRKITMSDFENMGNKLISENTLASEFNEQLTEIDAKGKEEITNYKKTLTDNKADLRLKKDGYLAMTTEKYFQEKYWDEKLEPYLKNLNFVPEFVKKEEPETKKTKDGKYETVNVMHVYVTNNLVHAKKENLPYTLKFILDAFEVTDELKNEIETSLNSGINVSEATTKTYEELFTTASDVTVESIKNKLLNYQGKALKLQSSIDFINWKLTQIKIYTNEKDQLTSDGKLSLAEANAQKFTKKEMKLKSLANIVTKVWGN